MTKKKVSFKQSLQILKGLLDFDTSVFCMNKLTT